MRVRLFILAATLGLLVLAPAGALHPEPRGNVARIGVFHVGDHIPPGLETLRAGLRVLGWEEGARIGSSSEHGAPPNGRQ